MLSARQKKTSIGIIAVVIVTVVLAATTVSDPDKQTPTASSSPTAFISEVHDTIDKHYWQEVSDDKLLGYFGQGIANLTGGPQPEIADKPALKKAVANAMETMSKQNRRQFPAQLTDLVLKSLPPQGRSRLYTRKKEKELANRVQNINPERNLYELLDVSKQATDEKIQTAYKNKKQELQQRPESTTTKEKREKITYAKNVLTDDSDRQQYDKTKSEPTVFAERLSPDIVHLAIQRYNRRTLKELSQAVKSIDMESAEPSSLVLDLRSNLGGSIDILPYFLGPLIGPDRPAYEFFQQDDTELFRTKTGWLKALVPYKKVVILVDEQTQSTGELMASVLKKYNVGTVVGETTRGWGTVERVFSLDNQYRDDREYSLFLVHHLTLRADGKPIQDRGVKPDVKINQSGWKNDLRKYMPHPPLIDAVERIWKQSPRGSQA